MQINTTIYGLVHPVTGELRYIGKTIKEPIKRLREHLNSPKYDKTKHVRNVRWIGSLQNLGLQPEMIIIEEVQGDAWHEAEAFWVAYFGSLGCKLNNLAPAGVGQGECTDELRQKRSEIGKARGMPTQMIDASKEDWIVTSPDGEVFEVNGLNSWARERGMESSCLVRVARGTRKQYRGWLCWKKSTGPIAYSGIDPTNLRKSDRNRGPRMRGPSQSPGEHRARPLKEYLVIDPSGNVVSLTRHDCKDLGIDPSALAEVSTSKRLSYKGYTSPAPRESAVEKRSNTIIEAGGRICTRCHKLKTLDRLIPQEREGGTTYRPICRDCKNAEKREKHIPLKLRPQKSSIRHAAD